MNLYLGVYRGKSATTNDKNQKNGHVTLIGMSGSGKSVQGQKMMCDIVEQGGTVLAIDTRNTLSDDQIFDSLKEKLKLYLYEINARGEGIFCDLFSPMIYSDGSMEHVVDTVDCITDIFASSMSLGCVQKAELRGAVQYVYENSLYEMDGISSLDAVLHYAGNKSAEQVREKLHSLTAHNLFRSGGTFYQEGKINVYRLSNLSPETQKIAAEWLLGYIWRLARAGYFKDKPIYLFIDECQTLPSGKESVLAQMLSEGRKFGVNLILATQMVLLGSTSAVLQRITQCGLLLYFKPAANRVSLTAKMIDPAAESDWCRLLRTLKVGEFIADGNFLVDGREVDEPLKISAVEV